MKLQRILVPFSNCLNVATGSRLISASTGDRRSNSSYESSKSNYEEAWLQSRKNPTDFWGEIAEQLVWTKKWKSVVDDSNPLFTKWFPGGQLNACYNTVDRHIDAGFGQEDALIYDSPVTDTIQKYTYNEIQQQVSLLAGVLSKLGIQKGDRVLIYMPRIPEAIFSMLATVRLGAVHSLVFGGFAAKELSVRINHCKPKIILSCNVGIEPGKIIPYKPMLDKAIELSDAKPQYCIIFQRPNQEAAELQRTRDLNWNDVLTAARPHDCVPVESSDPMYILYTSGTTGDPKGIVRPTGGHLAVLNWSMKAIYAMDPRDTWWAASDLGWVVGHSYICYGPLLANVKSVLYEGKPVGTPDSSSYFRVIHDHQVAGFFVAPTAIRAIRQEDPEALLGQKYTMNKLRYMFVAGEHCDNETLQWSQKKFRVPVLDNWWQTETGSPISASCMGLGMDQYPPKDVSGKPVPGWEIHVLNNDGSHARPNELGRIVAKLPLPPGMMSTLYRNDKKYLETYFEKYPGYYDTMDAGMLTAAGYVCVMSRDDDVINVSGHRFSTGALEEAILLHPDVADCAVIGIFDALKGEIPLGLFVTKKGTELSDEEITKELIRLVQESIGKFANFKTVVRVTALPKTRSGKIARKTIADLAKGKAVKIPVTIEDASVYTEIKQVLQKLGLAQNAPDPM